MQIDTMNCLYCPQKGASVVPCGSLSPVDQSFLREKHPNAVECAACNLCVFALHGPAQCVLLAPSRPVNSQVFSHKCILGC